MRTNLPCFASRWLFPWRLALLPVLLVALAGCESEQIQTYKVSKPETGPEPEAKVRMLAAVFLRGETSWFFKLTGPIADVAKLEKPFEDFVRTVRFADKDAKPTWKVPEGWKEQSGEGLRFATLKTGADDSALAVTVVSATGDLLANVNRWRVDQLGLKAARITELATMTREIEVGELKATIVDLRGPGATGRPGGMGPGVPPLPKPGGKPPFRYTAPEGWKETSTNFIEVLAWKTGDEPNAPKFAVSTAGGSLLENVNRWRSDQLGLARITDEQMRKDMRQIDVSGTSAPYFDLANSEKRILGVILERDGQRWFFKMIGPRDLVAKQQSAFEAFLKSVRFE